MGRFATDYADDADSNLRHPSNPRLIFHGLQSHKEGSHQTDFASGLSWWLCAFVSWCLFPFQELHHQRFARAASHRPVGDRNRGAGIAWAAGDVVGDIRGVAEELDLRRIGRMEIRGT